MKKVNNLIKRVVDLLSCLLGAILLSPILLIISVTIKLTSKGPVLFKQERLGRNGMIFEIFKFRTMVDNAENIGSGLKTFKNDPRITRVGNVLRKTSLDELPQLINVIKGDMSIIGPRPPVPYHPRRYEEYSNHQVQRFKVKPGITGLAQIEGRNILTWDERIEFDVEYVKKNNLLLDMKILFLTFVKVAKNEGIHSRENKKSN